jgi:Flp pilus assembly protein TadG
MPRPARTCRRFLSSTRGLAAVEFGMVFPMLLVLLLGSIDAGRAIAVYMKVRAATYALDAMTNQYSTVADSDLQTISGAAAAVLAPYPSGPLGLRISQVEVTTGGPIVAWSYGLNLTPYTYQSSNNLILPGNLGSTSAPNNACPTSFYTAGNVNGNGCYLLLAQVQYTYTPMFTQFITGAITISDSLYVMPRNSLCVQYNNSGCYSSST